MKKLLCLLLTCSAALCFLTATAQEKKWVTGSLKDADGNPVVSATISEKGTSNKVVSDAQGAFRLQVLPGATLVITSVGFATIESAAGDAPLNITLHQAAAGLDEVVVTALGIKREKKSLGYAMQEVKSKTLIDAREPNLTNALSGVVAGLQVIRSSNGPAGSSKINLRGNNSLTGKNQPLIVVDGVPVDNFVGVTKSIGAAKENNDYWNPGLDMGNGLADLNAEDIESISVLKGPTAAALYGSRAGNGAILVTTKTGKKQKGIGITLSSTLGFESIFTNPDMQRTFGQGSNGIFDKISGSNWGPQITGQEVTNWNGQKENLQAYNNVDNFFRNGVSNNHNLSFQQQYKNTSVYTSINYFNDKSLIPGTKLTRINLTGRQVSRFGKDDRWTLDTKIQYSNANARNRPQGGSNLNNYSSLLYLMPVSMDVRQFKNAVDQYGNMIWYGIGNQVNPYWSSRYNLNQDIRDRYILTGSLKYKFTEWLDAEIKAGSDMYTTNVESKVYAGSPVAINGRYANGKQTFSETNYSTLITAKKDDVLGKLGGNITLGGNLMRQKNARLYLDAGELKVPNLFSLRNGKNPPDIKDEASEQRINSVYGSVGVNWDGYLFLDATFRNDWSSTLAKVNRSYFYPSVSLSYVFTESFKGLPGWLTYGKLRTSYATVGNDMGPYQLYNTYNIENDPNSNTNASRKEVLYDPNVRSELIKSFEAGAELRFLNNRIGLDFSYYKSNATYQLIDLPMDPSSGYNFRKINAGNIQNSGFEVMADARIFSNPTGFNWNISANFSANRNKIIDISTKDSVMLYPLGSYDDVSVVAKKGELYGDIYGSMYTRMLDTKSPYYGQLILSGTGLPQRDGNRTNVKLGNQQPKALIGITNSFGYKGFTLAFLIDARIGGEIFSATQVAMQRNGSAGVTVMNGGREKITVDGVVADGSGGYTKNTNAITPQQYWEAITVNNLGITEANIYDATNVRLRNIQLSYELPGKFLNKTPIQRARVGVSCNNVWMITSHVRGIDPESVFATGTNAVGFENSSPPTTRTILFNLSLSF